MAKILLVEDDNNLREIYEARLMAEGYEITTARDGEEALAVAKKTQPDLIISDVMMPRISGFEMLDILRNTEGMKEVKVIMLTALGQAEDKTRADSLGADRYLVKSQVTLEDIVKAATDLLAGAPGMSAAAPQAAATPVAPAAVAQPMAAPQPQATAGMPPTAPPPMFSTPAQPQPATLPAPQVLAAAPAPAASAAPVNSDQIVADAFQDLVSNTPQPAPMPAPPTPLQTAPAAPVAAPLQPTPPVSMGMPAPQSVMPAAVPAPAAADDNDAVTIQRKKIIQPLPAGPEPKAPGLDELLAKEGITDMNTDQSGQSGQSGPSLPQQGDQPPHQPGHVISPNPTNAAGQPVDPNSISL